MCLIDLLFTELPFTWWFKPAELVCSQGEHGRLQPPVRDFSRRELRANQQGDPGGGNDTQPRTNTTHGACTQ